MGLVLESQRLSLHDSTVQILAQNPTGRDFVIGDIHGHYSELMQTLNSVAFDFDRDRLICCGDLVDKGAESEKVVALLSEPWFFSVRGNHDQFIVDQFHKAFHQERVLLWGGYAEMTPQQVHQKYAGTWFAKLPDAVQQSIAAALNQLPYALEVKTKQGRVGICHAGVPLQFNDWQDFVLQLQQPEGRKIKELTLRLRDPAFQNNRYIQGIDQTYHGHTGFRQIHTIGNSCWIDTFEKRQQFTLIDLT